MVDIVSPLPAVAIIPARLAATRLPRKPLLDRTGKPLIVHVIERVRQAKMLSRIIVATDSQEIADAVHRAGAEVAMTSPDHPNGSSRIAEVAAGLDGVSFGSSQGDDAAALPLIVNVQGDEPEVDPATIDALVVRLSELVRAGDPLVMATPAAPIVTAEDAANPNIVKVVADSRGRAMYFSRAGIPHDRDGQGARRLRHIGLYAYRRDFLLRYPTLPVTPLETCERLEQLRVLEHGYGIAVVEVAHAADGIDTPEQYERFVQRLKQGIA